MGGPRGSAWFKNDVEAAKWAISRGIDPARLGIEIVDDENTTTRRGIDWGSITKVCLIAFLLIMALTMLASLTIKGNY